MIPARFSFEYPERCLKIMETSAPLAEEMNLTTTFAVMMAMPLLLVPLERMNAAHPMGEHVVEPELHRELKRIRNKAFNSTPFWAGQQDKDWRLSKVVNSIEDTKGWRNSEGFHPSDPASLNEIQSADAGKVLRVMRNALAHGNIVYLDATGFETTYTPAQKIGFVSRTDGFPWDGRHRVLVVSEQAFMQFLRAWAKWIGGFHSNSSLALAA